MPELFTLYFLGREPEEGDWGGTEGGVNITRAAVQRLVLCTAGMCVCVCVSHYISRVGPQTHAAPSLMHACLQPPPLQTHTELRSDGDMNVSAVCPPALRAVLVCVCVPPIVTGFGCGFQCVCVCVPDGVGEVTVRAMVVSAACGPIG